MKLRKIMAGVVATALAASTLAVAASAACLTKVEGTESTLSTGTGMWLLQLYNKGNEAENKPETKLDIDYSKIAALTFTFQVNEEDKELWDGTIGGSVVFSCNGEKLGVQNDEDAAKAALFDKYNWPSCEFWGVLDEEVLGPVGEGSTYDDTKPGKVEKVGDYTYAVTNDQLVNPITAGDVSSIEDIGCMQVGLQEWGNGIAAVTVTKLEVKDASGNVLVSFDEKGVPTIGGASTPADTTAPDDTKAPDDSQAPATEAPATTGDSTKPNTNTGVESVAVVAGIAVLATGAVIVAKKRK
ncbi:MAG: hypothetical protein ACLS48_10350 [[Eubacterium] siraeum]